MVLKVVGALAAVAKVNYSRTVVDSVTARLHYQWSTTFCLMAGLLVIAKEYIGDAVECMQKGNDASKYINTYCWITSTFTINTTNGLDGLGHYNEEIHEKRVHTYYQWVPIVLAIQAGLFYLPHYLWKNMEGKQVDHLLQDVNKSLFDEDFDKKIKNMIAYLKESWGMNTRYFLGHFMCECLYLVNVVMQMILMDKFFNGAFMDYGSKVFERLQSDVSKDERFLEVFPLRAKCTFYVHGDSGTIKPEDALCIMPQNIINKKIFLIMWVWFIILTIITCLQLLCHLAVYFSGWLRKTILSRRLRCQMPPRMEQALRTMKLGDYCLLNSIGKNVNTDHFRTIMEGVTRVSEEVHDYSPSAPMYGTYKPFANEETMPRRRALYPTLSSGE
ncbi:innexin shaking-B-like [Portunus trituberculatus]|uniref:innexin shaking-B-like n=1 Tax=Portunus trituberculatus TaxID=210409 RepID=UPI001E1D152D|nr:innexin shaking-B-like [Portunus trituberculatus]